MQKFSLIGIDGNAFNIIGYVCDAIRKCKMTNEKKSAYKKDAMSSDYNHLLAVSCDMIDECNYLMGYNDNYEYDEDYDNEDYYTSRR